MMTIKKTKWIKQFTSSVFVFVMTITTAIAATSPDGTNATASDYDAQPAVLGDNTPPLVMLVMSNDHELFKKAYSDYTDLDPELATPDGLDTTYKNSFEYYGYFNSDKCYVYQTGSGYFEPRGDVDVVGSDHKCTALNTTWSGNFLNWVAMTRMDVVRKVLYGGKRSTDTGTDTVLERALIPSDVHAYVKVVKDSEIDGEVSDYTPFSDDEISLCNVTDYVTGSDLSGSLTTSNNPPLIKVVRGSYPQWSAAEVVQCQFDEEDNNVDINDPDRDSPYNPDRSEALSNGGSSPVNNGRYNARVKVCVSGEDQNSEFCRRYTDSGGTESYKPFGVLQQYGEDGSIKFGLMTGSYQQNNEGGVLRKNITEFAGPTAVIADNEIDLDDGTFNTLTNGIVSTLDGMRIAGWDYAGGGENPKYDDCDRHSITISEFKSSAVDGEKCRDWGNPLSEIYLEALRYFAGANSRTSSFNTLSDSSWISGMNTATWFAPGILTADNACANCSIIVLSTGLNMFDSDDLATASDLPNLSVSSDVSEETEDVGDIEGITGNYYIVGNVDDGTGSNTCTNKQVTSGNNGLAGVKGLCSEIPQLEGTYEIAGLSYYAKNTDLRTALDGTQNVTTYTVALAESLPSFEIETSSTNTISFVPSCQANIDDGASLGDDDWNDCSLTDVKVVDQSEFYGHMLFTWEDSHWGNDYDMDGVGSIEYCTKSNPSATECPTYSNDGTPPGWVALAGGQIAIRVSVPQANAGNALRFGFIMNGSNVDDGTYIELLRPGGQTIGQLSDTVGTILWDSVRTFTAAASTGDLLENPLWYAAKYGSFSDLDNDGTPDNVNGDDREWDGKDTLGNSGADGIPDNFFPVRNPSNLVDSLGEIFDSISIDTNSSSAAAVVGNSADGTGAVYQAAYVGKMSDVDDNEIIWTGSILSLFIDSESRLREDKCVSPDTPTGNDCNKELDDNDPEIRFRVDSDDDDGDEDFNEVVIDRYGINGVLIPGQLARDISDIDLLWDVNELLSSLSDVTTQRAYATASDDVSAGGRYIFTWIDSDQDANVDAAEVIDFDTGSFPTLDNNDVSLDPRRFLGFEDATESDGPNDLSDALVNFIRGEDQNLGGWRSRQFNDGSGTVTKRLGDIVHSSPVVVGRPNADYLARYGDAEYRAFTNRYNGRRQMVYVGANDGMLHAFNAGFYNAATKGFEVNTAALSGETEHPLGAEVWAYIPQSLLPHLQWLKDDDYPHVYYVDGDVQQFDVRIFDDCNSGAETCTHPFGWGTILVVTTRFGGGEISFDPNSDNADDATPNDPTDDITLQSSVMIFDVTDPEQVPTLLAELTHDQLGYTTSKPALFKERPKNSNGDFDTANEGWFLAIGSGPEGTDAATKQAALDSAISNQTARILAIDLNTMTWEGVFSTSQTSSFVGDIASMDWDGDYVDDAIYFGTIGGSVLNPTGQLMRFRPAYTSAPEVMLADSNQPYSAAPRPLLDRSNRRWVFAGTGRFFVADDILSSSQQSFHGVIEATDLTPGSITPFSKNKLIDTTRVEVFTTGEVRIAGSPIALITVSTEDNSITTDSFSTFAEMQTIIPETSGANGWFIDLQTPASRNLLSPALIRDVLVFDEYTPSGEMCTPVGTSRLMNLNMLTGTASPFVIFETDSTNFVPSGGIQVLSGVDQGEGQIIGIAPHNDTIIVSKGGDGLEINTEAPTIIGTASGRRSWREILLNQ